MGQILLVVYSKKLWQTATLQGWVGDRSRERMEIKLESEAWFAWLEAEQSFRFSYWQASGESVNEQVALIEGIRYQEKNVRSVFTIGGETFGLIIFDENNHYTR